MKENFRGETYARARFLGVNSRCVESKLLLLSLFITLIHVGSQLDSASLEPQAHFYPLSTGIVDGKRSLIFAKLTVIGGC